MRRLDALIADIVALQGITSLPTIDSDRAKANLKTAKEAGVYLDIVARGGKPETALSDYLFRPLLEGEDFLSLRMNPQMKGGDGWVDYLVEPTVGNPVAFELKPLHVLHVDDIRITNLDAMFRSLEAEGNNQVKQYLRDYDYVLFTNMVDIYYFNREALLTFTPFLKEPFLKLIDDLKVNRDIWDVVRRKEDRTPRHDLDKHFFVDLKSWYGEFSRIRFNERVHGDEKIVQLLNKFVFVKTLEDFSLIPFNFLRDTYEEKQQKWNTKGRKRVFREFFSEIDKWCYDYYDTELFKEDFFEHIAGDDANLKELQFAVEKILGISPAAQLATSGIIHYNYRTINEDIFGKAYETFLAEERKQQGIFYTPSAITEYMCETVVNSLFVPPKEAILATLQKGDYDKAMAAAEALTEIKIIDAACGSGSFLIKALKHIWKVYEDIGDKTSWATSKEEMFEPETVRIPRERTLAVRDALGVNGNNRKAISLAILRHLYGIDLDEKAVDVAKANIWKEAVKLSPASFRYTSLPETANHILPNLELNFVVGNSVVDLPFDDSIELLSEFHQDDIIKLHSIRDTYLRDPFDPDAIRDAMDIKQRVRESLYRCFSDRGYTYLSSPLFVPLEFFFSFFDRDGNPLPDASQGMQGVIGNPPWENIKPITKEFAARFPNIFGDITKFSLSGKEFEGLFQRALDSDQTFREAWGTYASSIEALSAFIRQNYCIYGSSGDLSYQKVFLERALMICQRGGMVALLVPSGFHTDEGQMELRKEILDKYTLLSLMSFENRGSCLFPDIDPRFKFDSLIIRKSPNTEGTAIATRYYIHDIDDVREPFMLNPHDIAHFSPQVLGFVEFRNHKDAEIALAIRGSHPLLSDTKMRILSEFHMTNDNNLFHDRRSPSRLPLYEGKMIYQYTCRYADPQHWISESDGRERLLKKEVGRIAKLIRNLPGCAGLKGKALKDFKDEKIRQIKEKFNGRVWKLDYEVSRLAYRAVARSTDERTLIATILPPGVFTGHSLNVFKSFFYEIEGDDIVQKMAAPDNIAFALAFLNSFTTDYYMRLRVSANLTTFFLYELPFPEVQQTLRSEIIELACKLLGSDEGLREFTGSLGVSDAASPDELLPIRSRIECLIAKEVFGLNKDQLGHTLSSFVFGSVDTVLIHSIQDLFDEI